VLRAAIALSLALAAAACNAPAQGRASEHGLVAQTIANTTITIEYYRPVARGRDSLFGRVVHWGDTWTPGANWATTLETDQDIRLNGKPLPKGKYSVWMIPRRDSAWTVMLSRSAHRFHMQHPDPSDEQLRFTAKPEQGVHMETLSWYFPVVTPSGATLRMHWGTTMVPITVAVDAPPPAALAPAERAPLLGTYHLLRAPTAGGGAPPQFDLEITEADGRLRARMVPGPPDYAALEMVPAGKNRFQLALNDKGQLFVEPEWTLVFQVAGARATAIEMRGEDDRLIARGDRAK
jgi:hypothetical protein